MAPDNAGRLLAGQSWQLSEDIGHPFGLTQPLHIGRTSSQDTGVDRLSDVIIATAALEIGYNDPDVGAVMQHKAPCDWAAFLQRRGRAGRRRMMRPWTTVVLSDYGRDRLAYQAYEQLFDPELPQRSLPVGNRYVLRMQATFALMDWLSNRMPQTLPHGSIWQDLSGPAIGTGWWVENLRRRHEWVQNVLLELIEGVPDTCSSLDRYLQGALAISPEETSAVLWDPPRPIYTAVVPTLLRRLESGWRRICAHPDEPETDHQAKDHPLPDFVPQQLFGDLNLPEVEIIVPAQIRGEDPESHFLAIVQALQTLAPGRVTRRFGYRHAFANHWVAPTDLRQPNQVLAVEAYCSEFQEEGRFQFRAAAGIETVRCVRPWKINPVPSPGELLPTSNAQLVWRSQLSPAREDDRFRFLPPRSSAWDGIIPEICFYTHNQHTHVQVRRFAIASRANLSFRDGTQSDTTVNFVERETGEPAAIGFTQEADGIVFRFRVPADLGISPDHANRRKFRSFRTGYFREMVQADPAIGLVANQFQRDWLVQIYLSAIITRATIDVVAIEEAYRRIHDGNASRDMERVLDVIFQSLDDPNGGGPVRQRVHDTLLGLCRDLSIIAALSTIAPVLWRPPDEGFHSWCVLRFKATLGGALLRSLSVIVPSGGGNRLVPRHRTRGLGRQAAPPFPEDLEEIWITETTIGGGGVVEEVLRAYAADPRHFFRLVRRPRCDGF